MTHTAAPRMIMPTMRLPLPSLSSLAMVLLSRLVYLKMMYTTVTDSDEFAVFPQCFEIDWCGKMILAWRSVGPVQASTTREVHPWLVLRLSKTMDPRDVTIDSTVSRCHSFECTGRCGCSYQVLLCVTDVQRRSNRQHAGMAISA